MELDTIKKSDYQMKSTAGSMPFNSTLGKVQHSYQVVPWTHAADGLLRAGDSLMLRNKKTAGELVCDLGVRPNNIDECYRLHTSKVHKGPVSRNVYQIMKVEKADIFGADNIIRFG
jgi:hypothetical protein